MAIISPPNENELLHRLATGDQRAFTELFDAYYRPLGEYVFKLTESLPITEEIVQDVFIKIWIKRETVSTLKSFKNYLFILCRNQTFDALRKKAKQHLFQQKLEQFFKDESELDGLENPVEEYREWIEQSVAKLPPQQQKVYVLSRYERLKHEEIAAKLQLSTETVKKHIQYATRFIQNDLRSRLDATILFVLMSNLF
ncbi:RNA polymerase sigma-70 factor [Pedobacter nyackensis]|uniref:RNA polymerase sigma-70 factor n=1 Tax=Pedobacter nyackensis TaxID=475255 RepID=UPI00292D8618|nr:RNA polymerase sigma-70 factor [Pedobacter nyackensis]